MSQIYLVESPLMLIHLSQVAYLGGERQSGLEQKSRSTTEDPPLILMFPLNNWGIQFLWEI